MCEFGEISGASKGVHYPPCGPNGVEPGGEPTRWWGEDPGVDPEELKRWRPDYAPPTKPAGVNPAPVVEELPTTKFSLVDLNGPMSLPQLPVSLGNPIFTYDGQFHNDWEGDGGPVIALPPPVVVAPRPNVIPEGGPGNIDWGQFPLPPARPADDVHLPGVPLNYGANDFVPDWADLGWPKTVPVGELTPGQIQDLANAPIRIPPPPPLPQESMPPSEPAFFDSVLDVMAQGVNNVVDNLSVIGNGIASFANDYGEVIGRSVAGVVLVAGVVAMVADNLTPGGQADDHLIPVWGQVATDHANRILNILSRRW